MPGFGFIFIPTQFSSTNLTLRCPWGSPAAPTNSVRAWSLHPGPSVEETRFPGFLFFYPGTRVLHPRPVPRKDKLVHIRARTGVAPHAGRVAVGGPPGRGPPDRGAT